MTGDGSFIEKAKEAEAVAASTEDSLLRMTLRILAQEYRTLAEQEEDNTFSPPPRLQPEVKP